MPADPVIEIGGAVTHPIVLPLSALASMPRLELTADFHCVAGWSATGLRWEGVPFAALHREVVEPAIRPGATVTHLVFAGLDGHRSVVALEDALAEDVLIAEHLGGRPLDGDHGAPARLVSPQQYGHISTKHLCRIEACTARPTAIHAAHWFSRLALHGPLVRAHPRARVWEEERHPYLPARWLRRPYRLTIQVGVFLGARAGRRSRPPRTLG